MRCAAEPCDDLCEWDYGDYEGITTAEIRRHTPDWTVWTHGCPGGEDALQVQVRCNRVIQRALAGTWLGLGAQGGRHFALATGSLSVLGREREQPVILRWNVPC